jgi:Flp pilus assembly pilin Flp
MMMVRWYVRASCGVQRVVRRLRKEQQGLTMVEYGVAAAFLVLFLVGALMVVGPQLRDWIKATMNRIVSGQGA